jgi:tight adherence protein C
MSDQTYILVAVIGTFVAVLVGGATYALSAQSRRSSRVLEAHIRSAGVAVAHAPQEAPFRVRVLEPFGRSVGSLIDRITPSGIREGVARKLVLSGYSGAWSPEALIAIWVLLAVGGGVLGYVFGMTGDPHLLGPFWIPLLAWVGFLLPSSWLDRKARARQEAIRRMLPDVIDMLTISVEAGLAFDAALLQARRAMKGPLPEEIGRMLHEMQLGVSRPDAMRHLADRTNVEELRSFVLAMVQADVFGVSVANVLRGQSQEMRVRRRQRAEERAMKVPVKLLFPMIVCVLPALMILVVGPGVIRIADDLF